MRVTDERRGDGWKDRRTEGQKDGRTEGQKDRTYSAGLKAWPQLMCCALA